VGVSLHTSHLLLLHSQVVPDQLCRDKFAPFVNVTVDLCAYETGRDACYGDSGSALFRWQAGAVFAAIGITSRGAGCAQQGQPGVYVYSAQLFVGVVLFTCAWVLPV
jgi:secreted trypsin-like serine protease